MERAKRCLIGFRIYALSNAFAAGVHGSRNTVTILTQNGRLNVNDHSSWTTENELQFVKHLGTWATESKSVRTKTRRKLLELYLKATNFRDNWGGISRVQVVGYAEQCLENEPM